MSELIEVKVDSLAYGGEALARMPDGRVIFVAYAIPGEVVRLRLVEDKPKYVKAELVEVVEPSPRRVLPRCQHFGMCGGCHYQHMDHASEVESKRAILQEQLGRIGGLHDLPPIEVIPSTDEWYYRNTLQFHLTDEGKLGFHKARSNRTFQIQECHLPEPDIQRLWPQIEIEPIPGLERISLRHGMDDELMVVLESDGTQGFEFSIENLPVSIVQTGPAGSLVLAGSEYLRMAVLDRLFVVSAESFFQVNQQQAMMMVEHLLKNLPLEEGMTLLDAYCGVGLFSAFLAPKVKRLVGIEVSPTACEDFALNLDEFEHVELYEAPVEDVLGSINFKPDVIVMDPPRAGLNPQTVKKILAQGAEYLAYVSCDPATLGRDSKQLAAGGYTLSKLALFDMFPQTYHMESIGIWKKA
jgi:23S rRNA (uracil1939-C5)-methyltransferase